MRLGPTRIDRDESGAALVMAVIVMLVLAGLSSAVLARTLSVMSFVRNGQDFDAALAAADAGLADALFQIDQGVRPSWTDHNRPTSGTTGTTLPNATTGAGTFEYWATKVSDSQYVVTSVGAVGRSKHGIQARVTRTAQFPYALFSNSALHLSGTTSVAGLNVNFYSYNQGLADIGAPVRVGSNATVVCSGPPDPNIFIDWYQSQSECPSDKVSKLAKPRDITFPEPPRPPGATNQGLNWEHKCPTSPTNGVFGDPLSTLLAPVVVNGNDSPIVCRRDVQMLGTLVPDPAGPPVKIYILPTYDLTTGKVIDDHALDLSTAVINPAQSATRFQIFKVGDEPIVNTGNTSGSLTFRGVLFAPDTPLTINGGIWWAGSINVGQLRVNGAPNIKIGYDNDLATYLGPDWGVSRYREIPSSEAGFISIPTP